MACEILQFHNIILYLCNHLLNAEKWGGLIKPPVIKQRVSPKQGYFRCALRTGLDQVTSRVSSHMNFSVSSMNNVFCLVFPNHLPWLVQWALNGEVRQGTQMNKTPQLWSQEDDKEIKMNPGSRMSEETGLFKELNDACFVISALVQNSEGPACQSVLILTTVRSYLPKITG